MTQGPFKDCRQTLDLLVNKPTDQVKVKSQTQNHVSVRTLEGFAMVIRASGTHSDLIAGILDEKQPEWKQIFKQMDRLCGPESRRPERAAVLASALTGSDSCYHISAAIATCANLRAPIAGPASAGCTGHCQETKTKPKSELICQLCLRCGAGMCTDSR